jgi:hypothetical protein
VTPEDRTPANKLRLAVLHVSGDAIGTPQKRISVRRHARRELVWL